MLGYYYGTVFMANVPNPAPGLEISESTDVSRSDKCWVYMHLQKSGGTTVKGILRGVWKDRFAIYDSPHWVKGDKFLQYFGRRLATGNRWNVIAGGYPEALRRSRAAAEKCLWFTQFRHPIPRMVSAYYYCKRSSTDHACASKVVNAKDATLETFAKHWGNFAVRQFALSFVDITDVMEYSKTDAARERLPPSISDVPSLPGWYLLKMYLDSHVAPEASQHGQIPDLALYEMLQPAQDLLRDNYTAVGILEEFDTTLSLYDVALSIPGIDWHKNFASQGKKAVAMDYAEKEAASLAEAWTNSEIKKYMQLDIVLYEHAVDVFRKKAQAYGI